MNKHVKTAHEGLRLNCDLCERQFVTKNALKVHKEIVHEGNKARYHCEFCGKTFAYERSFGLHVNNVHKGIKHKCDICGKLFNKKSYIKHHKATIHAGEKSYNCELCGKHLLIPKVLNFI